MGVQKRSEEVGCLFEFFSSHLLKWTLLLSTYMSVLSWIPERSQKYTSGRGHGLAAVEKGSSRFRLDNQDLPGLMTSSHSRVSANQRSSSLSNCKSCLPTSIP